MEKHASADFLDGTEGTPSLLVSYVYLNPFLRIRHGYNFRNWVMDSGAFSAHESGNVIDLQEYIDTCGALMESDSKLHEVFALDVIGDHEASIRNTEEMWRQGIPAIPAYHLGEPEDALIHIAKEYPKIALGGVVRYRRKLQWAQQCFARVWPKKIHGFGFGGQASVLALPWHSVDASNWEIAPCKFGRWNSFGNLMGFGGKQNLRAEVEWYLRLEQQARTKWRRQMEEICGPDHEVSPNVRLADNGSTPDRRAMAMPLTEESPSVRLADAAGPQIRRKLAFGKPGAAKETSG